jgi:steroid 5-alpha reductase family enzyme
MLGLGISLTGGLVLWLASLRREDASIADIAWGPGFAVLSWLYLLRTGPIDGRAWLVAALVTVWGFRLGAHIWWRGRGRGEDRRYAAMRRRHGSAFPVRSLFTVFFLQAALLALLSHPHLVAIYRPAAWSPWGVAGLALWTIGFGLEAVADAQLLRFQRRPGHEHRVLDSGLWRYSRHPNYFGEALLWWGYGLLALPHPRGGFALWSPLVMTLLLVKGSGVPLLEAGIEERRPGYRRYVETTSAFVPWPPRKRRESP